MVTTQNICNCELIGDSLSVIITITIIIVVLHGLPMCQSLPTNANQLLPTHRQYIIICLNDERVWLMYDTSAMARECIRTVLKFYLVIWNAVDNQNQLNCLQNSYSFTNGWNGIFWNAKAFAWLCCHNPNHKLCQQPNAINCNAFEKHSHEDSRDRLTLTIKKNEARILNCWSHVRVTVDTIHLKFYYKIFVETQMCFILMLT